MNTLFKFCKSFGYTRVLHPNFRLLSTSTKKQKYIDEPDYLQLTQPQVPVYDLLNIQMRGYDFTVLEHYGKHVHKIARNMEIDIVDGWATPHQAWKVTNLEPGTTKVTREYKLNKYERNLQIADLPAYCAPTFFEIIQSSLPAGVSVSIHPHEEQHDEIRYIPDFELLALKDQLQELTNPEEK